MTCISIYVRNHIVYVRKHVGHRTRVLCECSMCIPDVHKLVTLLRMHMSVVPGNQTPNTGVCGDDSCHCCIKQLVQLIPSDLAN